MRTRTALAVAAALVALGSFVTVGASAATARGESITTTRGWCESVTCWVLGCPRH